MAEIQPNKSLRNENRKNGVLTDKENTVGMHEKAVQPSEQNAENAGDANEIMAEASQAEAAKAEEENADAVEKQKLLGRIGELEAQLAELRGEDEDRECVKAFFEAFPGAESFADEICAYIDMHDGCEGLEQALLYVLLDKYKTPEQLASDENFLKTFIFENKRVKEKMIADYIDSLARTPSVCIERGGLLQTKHEKPATVRAAGELARALFRKQQ